MGIDLSLDDFTFQLFGRVNIGRLIDWELSGNLILFSVNLGACWR